MVSWIHRSTVANMLDCDIVVSEYENQFHYYVPFLDYYIWGKYETPYTLSSEFHRTITILLLGWLWHWIIDKINMPLNKEIKDTKIWNVEERKLSKFKIN